MNEAVLLNEEEITEQVSYRRAIKDWPQGERPREKMIARGADALTDAELLAILINSGSGTRSAVDVARDLLIAHGDLRAIARRPVVELQKGRGIGPARAVAIAAAFELGRRNASMADPDYTDVVSSPEDVARRYIPRLRDLSMERFIAVMLNNAGRIVGEREISRGSVDASIATPREVFQAAVLDLATAIILIHNHPSGVREASREDRVLTRQMVNAGLIIGIPIQDHIIVCGNSYISFANEGWL